MSSHIVDMVEIKKLLTIPSVCPRCGSKFAIIDERGAYCGRDNNPKGCGYWVIPHIAERVEEALAYITLAEYRLRTSPDDGCC